MRRCTQTQAHQDTHNPQPLRLYKHNSHALLTLISFFSKCKIERKIISFACLYRDIFLWYCSLVDVLFLYLTLSCLCSFWASARCLRTILFQPRSHRPLTQTVYTYVHVVLSLCVLWVDSWVCVHVCGDRVGWISVGVVPGLRVNRPCWPQFLPAQEPPERERAEQAKAVTITLCHSSETTGVFSHALKLLCFELLWVHRCIKSENPLRDWAQRCLQEAGRTMELSAVTVTACYEWIKARLEAFKRVLMQSDLWLNHKGISFLERSWCVNMFGLNSLELISPVIHCENITQILHSRLIQAVWD